MKQKAFTLVELLAVLVILAIIALITTPIVLNMIEKSKINSAEISFKNVGAAAKLYYVEEGRNKNTEFVCKDEVCKSGDKILALEGQAPSDGIINIDDQGNITFTSIIISGYYCHIENNEYICESVKNVKDETTDGSIALDNSKTEILTNYRIYGNSYQETRSGKNLFDIGTTGDWLRANNDSVIPEDWNFSINGNSISNKSIPSAMGGIISNKKIINDNNKYVITSNLIGNGITEETNARYLIRYFDENGNNISENYQNYNTYYKSVVIGVNALVDYKLCINVPEEVHSFSFGLAFYINDDSSDILTYSNIQIEKGTTATTYEPYGAMPSPEYPSEIQSVGDLVTDSSDPNYGKYEIPIKVRGKNLFDLNSAIITGGILENNTVTSNNTTTNIDLYLKKGTYLLSFNRSNNGYVFLRKGQVSNGYFAQVSTGKVAKFTFTEDEYLRITYFSDGGQISNIMLVDNTYTKDTMPEYEPYKETTASIYLDEPLRCVGDVCDYIDFEKGIVVRNVKQIVINGEEKVYSYTYSSMNGIRFHNILEENMNRRVGMSNRSDKVGSIFKNNAMWLGVNNNKNIYWVGILDQLGITTTDEFTQWSKEQYNNGNPTIINYVLESPVVEKIELPNISTFESATTLEVETSLKPSKIEIEYYK